MTILFLFLSVVAIIFKFFPPKRINYLYGYRTSRSMKNTQNWNLANRYSATLMLVISLSLLLLSYAFDYSNVEAQTLLIGLLVFSLSMLIFLTERKLKKSEL